LYAICDHSFVIYMVQFEYSSPKYGELKGWL